MEICIPEYRTFFLLLFALLLPGCAKSHPTIDSVAKQETMNARHHDSEVEEQAVYSTLIQGIYGRTDGRPLTILSETTASKLPKSDLADTLHKVAESFPGGISSEAVNDFLGKNLESRSLAKLNTAFEHKLISKEDLDRIFQKGGGWAEYYANYNARGIIELSRVGFSDNMDQALVYTGIQSGLKTGIGYYVLLTKENNTWTLKYKTEVWVS